MFDIKNNLYKSLVCFFFTFILFIIYINSYQDMIFMSGDSKSIWATITTFYSDKITSSYVLYKGFLSVYPYVWLYKLATILGTNDFFFIRIYQSILFGYLAGVGLPYLVQALLRINANLIQRMFLVIFMLWIWDFNTALNMISADLPSLVILVLASNAVLKIANNYYRRWYLGYLYAGFLCGLGLCFSGQYLISIALIMLYIITIIFSNKETKTSVKRSIKVFSIICLMIGILLVPAYNSYFEKTIVNSMREAGEWIPEGSDWIKYTAMSNMALMKYGTGAQIPDNHGLAILKELEGDNFDKVYDIMVGGGYPVDVEAYIGMIKNHPLDFITRWVNRLFIGMSSDNAVRSVTHLFLNYTFIFMALYEIKIRCIKVKDIFCRQALIPLAFFAAVLVPCFMHVELRYFIPLQALVYSVAFLSPTVWLDLKNFIKGFKQCLFENTIKNFVEKNFPYIFVIYFLFIVICFTHFASVYDAIGTDPNAILFTL